MTIKTINEVRERRDRLVSNLDMIKNIEGHKNISLKINILNNYLNDPDIDLREEIKTSYGTKKLTLKWIKGEAR